MKLHEREVWKQEMTAPKKQVIKIIGIDQLPPPFVDLSQSVCAINKETTILLQGTSQAQHTIKWHI